jgi:hypothetical protein
MANDLTLTQLSTVLNSIASQATGKAVLTPTNTSEFVAVAQTALKAGFDPLLNAISQVLSKTIYSNRPYSRKFGGIETTNQKFGNITRKLNICDKNFEDDDRITLTDGESVDMFKVNKPVILQTNFYGASVYQKSLTLFRDQLDTAFSSPDEFGAFVSMVIQNLTDQMEQARENLARATVANFISGKVTGDTANTVHLISEYMVETGETGLTAANIFAKANFMPFMQWAFARIASISSMMSERSQKYHINVTGKEVSRHTPIGKQKAYLYAPVKFKTESMVLANTFHDNFLQAADNEVVNFWQSIETPDTIDVKPTYLKPDGTLITPAEAVSTANIFGTIFDEEALGYTLVNQWSLPTPFNARGGYSNIIYHETGRYWNDFTENGVVLLLD